MKSVEVVRKQRKQILKLNKKLMDLNNTIEKLGYKLDKLNEDLVGLSDALQKDKQALSKIRSIKSIQIIQEAREVSHRAVDTALTKEQIQELIKNIQAQIEQKEKDLEDTKQALKAFEEAL